MEFFLQILGICIMLCALINSIVLLASNDKEGSLGAIFYLGFGLCSLAYLLLRVSKWNLELGLSPTQIIIMAIFHITFLSLIIKSLKGKQFLLYFSILIYISAALLFEHLNTPGLLF